VTVKTDVPLEPPASVSTAPLSFLAGFSRYWLPVVLWGALFLRPILRWFNPQISDEAIYRVQYGVRKAAHVCEYAMLALLVWRARRRPAPGERRPWDWREAGLAFAFAAVFALSDELHQALVPSREARLGDVLLDSLGAALGLLALRAYGRWRGRW